MPSPWYCFPLCDTFFYYFLLFGENLLSLDVKFPADPIIGKTANIFISRLTQKKNTECLEKENTTLTKRIKQNPTIEVIKIINL